MLDHVNDIYSSLYRDEGISLDAMHNIVFVIEKNPIPEDSLEGLENDITPNEVRNAVFQMN